MKYSAIILTAVLFLSCGNVNKREFPSPDFEMEKGVERTETVADTAMSETTPEEVQVKEKPSVVAPESKKAGSFSSSAKSRSYPSTKSSRRSSSSMRHSDNMRGFDPASEDDMDNNGMSRYMENNDDEGWD